MRSTPPGARVFVDGREYGRTPVTVGNLARGGHSVRVTRDGYATDERQVTITSGAAGPLDHRTPVARTPASAWRRAERSPRFRRQPLNGVPAS